MARLLPVRKFTNIESSTNIVYSLPVKEVFSDLEYVNIINWCLDIEYVDIIR